MIVDGIKDLKKIYQEIVNTNASFQVQIRNNENIEIKTNDKAILWEILFIS